MSVPFPGLHLHAPDADRLQKIDVPETQVLHQQPSCRLYELAPIILISLKCFATC